MDSVPAETVKFIRSEIGIVKRQHTKIGALIDSGFVKGSGN